MNYDEIEHFRTNHPAWSLLRSANVALVMSFLGRVFLDRNVADLPARQLASELDDELYSLNQRLGEDRFPKTAVEYLDDWASPERGWLRKFYPHGSDEAIGDKEARLAHIHFDWIDACERTQATSGCFPTSFVASSTTSCGSKNKRVFDLVRAIESKALRVRDVRDPALATELDDPR